MITLRPRFVTLPIFRLFCKARFKRFCAPGITPLNRGLFHSFKPIGLPRQGNNNSIKKGVIWPRQYNFTLSRFRNRLFPKLLSPRILFRMSSKSSSKWQDAIGVGWGGDGFSLTSRHYLTSRQPSPFSQSHSSGSFWHLFHRSDNKRRIGIKVAHEICNRIG